MIFLVEAQTDQKLADETKGANEASGATPGVLRERIWQRRVFDQRSR